MTGRRARVRRPWSAGAVLAGAWLAATPATAQVTLRGEVLDRDGRPVEDVRLVIVGHPPEVVVRDGGAFSHPLSGAPAEVTVRVVGAPGIDVLFPPGGRVPVPADPDAVVPVLVGETLDTAVRERIQADLRAIRETLALRGVTDDQIEAAVSAEMEGVLARLEELTRGAVESAVTGAEQVELRERLNRHLTAYLRAAGDLARIFSLVEEREDMGEGRFQLLYQSIVRYNEAYVSLDGELGATPAAVERAWPGPVGHEGRRRLEAFLDDVERGFHDGVRALTEDLDVIQQIYVPTERRPGGRERRAARGNVAAAAPGLNAAVAELRASVAALLDGLAAPGRG